MPVAIVRDDVACQEVLHRGDHVAADVGEPGGRVAEGLELGRGVRRRRGIAVPKWCRPDSRASE